MNEKTVVNGWALNKDRTTNMYSGLIRSIELPKIKDNPIRNRPWYLRDTLRWGVEVDREEQKESNNENDLEQLQND